MYLEVIVQNGEEAKIAERFDADLLELVSAMEEDGLTPSYGVMKQVINSVSIPVQVMIRPHAYGYNYNDTDLEIIREDIKKVLELGGKRIVFGTLTKEKKVDEYVLKEIIKLHPELNI